MSKKIQTQINHQIKQALQTSKYQQKSRAIVLSSLLTILSATSAMPKASAAIAKISPSNAITQPSTSANPQINQQTKQIQEKFIPASLAKLIMGDMEEKTGIPITSLQITEATPQLWDSCLNLPFLDAPCNQIGIPGWRVTVESYEQRWVYHATEKNGFKLNAIASLSPHITEEILADVAWRSEIPISQLKVIWAESKTWSNGCLGLPTMGGCTMALVPGWRVIVSDSSQQRWVYRASLSGNARYDAAASTVTRNIPLKFPQSYGQLALQDMAKKSTIPIEQLRVVKAENKTRSECQGIVKPINPCATPVEPIPLWEVTVEGIDQKWIYQVSNNEVKLLALQSLPPTLSQAILQTARNDSQLNPNQVKILSVEDKVWNNTCMDIANDFCRPLEFPGWQVTVTDGKNQLVYHTDLNGSIRLKPNWSF